MSKSKVLKRAYSSAEVLNKKYKEAIFEGKWAEFIGKPEIVGVWLVWGASGEGKTSFCLQLADYMTNFGRVAYDALEQGISKALKVDIVRNNLQLSKILFLDRESIEDLKNRLRRKSRAPQIVIIDSLQYTGINYEQYKELKKEFKNKLFIMISHAIGDLPRGAVAESARYDVDVKIQVKGFKAFAVTSRFLQKESVPYVIWKEGADKYWIK